MLVVLFCQLYEEALAENEKLKACLQDSKQDLVKFRLQLDKVTQVSPHPKTLKANFESLKVQQLFHINFY